MYICVRVWLRSNIESTTFTLGPLCISLSICFLSRLCPFRFYGDVGSILKMCLSIYVSCMCSVEYISQFGLSFALWYIRCSFMRAFCVKCNFVNINSCSRLIRYQSTYNQLNNLLKVLEQIRFDQPVENQVSKRDKAIDFKSCFGWNPMNASGHSFKLICSDSFKLVRLNPIDRRIGCVRLLYVLETRVTVDD